MLLLIAASLYPACTKEGAKPVAATSEQDVAQRSAGNLQVTILPNSPTILTDLQAVFSGEGKVSYQWTRNGQPVIGVASERLQRDQFTKGDTIAVTVVSGASQ